jgi:hypothetical protein
MASLSALASLTTAGVYRIRNPDRPWRVQVECEREPRHDFFGSNCALDRMMKASVWLTSSTGT